MQADRSVLVTYQCVWSFFFFILQQILDRKSEQLELQKEKLQNFSKSKSGSDRKDVKDPGGVVVDMKQAEQIQPAGVEVKYDVKWWSGGYVALKKAVSVADDMCSWEEAPKAQADIQV